MIEGDDDLPQRVLLEDEVARVAVSARHQHRLPLRTDELVAHDGDLEAGPRVRERSVAGADRVHEFVRCAPLTVDLRVVLTRDRQAVRVEQSLLLLRQNLLVRGSPGEAAEGLIERVLSSGRSRDGERDKRERDLQERCGPSTERWVDEQLHGHGGGERTSSWTIAGAGARGEAPALRGRASCDQDSSEPHPR